MNKYNPMRRNEAPMFQTVIFDLDGTILNTLEDLSNAGNAICRQNGWPEHTQTEFRQLVGSGIHNLIEQVAPASVHSPLLVATAVHQFCSNYEAHLTDCSCPYPGVEALLAQCKAAGVTMGVYSNKNDGFCQTLVEKFFPNTFAHVQGKCPGVPVKPDVMGTQQVLQALGADPATTLFVGDSGVDVATAKNAGLSCCAVTWGFRDRDDLEGATYIVDSPEEIATIVLGA